MKYTIEQMKALFEYYDGDRNKIMQAIGRSPRTIRIWAKRIGDKYPEFPYYKKMLEKVQTAKKNKEDKLFPTNDERIDHANKPYKTYKRHYYENAPKENELDNYGFDEIPDEIRFS